MVQPRSLGLHGRAAGRGSSQRYVFESARIVGAVERGTALSVYRGAFALLALAAIVVQLVDLAANGTLNVVNYFSYFTIQSNLIGVAVFVFGATRRAYRSPRLDQARGAATTYLTITFVVFSLLLAGTDVDTAIPWVNTVLHEIFPVAVMVDWLLDPPARRITAQQAVTWLIYPIAWTGYSLIRGGLTGRYPYPFLDPANGGYGTVTVYVVGIFVLGLVVIGAVAAAGNALGDRFRRPATA